MYGIEAAGVTPKKIGSLAAAVIDVFKNRNNNHNANQFFSTMTKGKSDLDPVAQIFARRVTQVRRTACKKKTCPRKVPEDTQDLCRQAQKREPMAGMV